MTDLFNTKKILGRGRYPWVDYARGICILLVVYRHVFEGLGNVGAGSYSYPMLKYFNIFFFSFRMPLFFIVSGIFLGGSLARKGLNEYISSRFNTIFYPLLIWGTIQVTLQLVFANYVNADRDTVDYLYLIIDPRKIEQFWYLNALFFVSVIYAVLRWYLKFKAYQQMLLGIVLFVISCYCHSHNINIGLLKDVTFFYMFFAFGDLITGFFLNDRNYAFMSSYKTMLVVLPVFILVQYYFTGLNLEHGDDYFVQYQRPLIYVVAALVGGIFIINLSFVLQRLNIFRFFRVIGYHSLYIYAMHLIVTAAVRALMINVFHVENIPVLMVICIAMGVLIPMLFFNFAERIGASWLFYIKKRKPAGKQVIQPSLYFEKGMLTPKESTEGKKITLNNNDQ